MEMQHGIQGDVTLLNKLSFIF